MVLIAFSNPIWTLWPEGLMITAAIIYLSGTNIWAPDVSVSPTRIRLLSFVGLFVTGSTVLLGIVPSYYTIIAIPLIPAALVFGVLVFRPQLIQKWHWLRVYLKISVIISGLAWTVQLLWLFAR